MPDSYKRAMSDYTPEELTEHHVHNALKVDQIGCRICDAVARQRGSLIDNDQINGDAAR